MLIALNSICMLTYFLVYFESVSDNWHISLPIYKFYHVYLIGEEFEYF